MKLILRFYNTQSIDFGYRFSFTRMSMSSLQDSSYLHNLISFNRCVGLGLCYTRSRRDNKPGWNEGSQGYHYDGGLREGLPIATRNRWDLFGTGDTVGYEFSHRTRSIFFTKNGVYLGMRIECVNVEQQSNTYLGTAFTGVKGVLVPVVSMKDEGAQVRFNFGAKEFVYRGLEEHNHYVPKQVRTKKSIVGAA